MAIGQTKQFSSTEFVRILLDNGFVYDRCKGSHKLYRRGNDVVVIPSRNCNKMLARRIIKTYNLKLK